MDIQDRIQQRMLELGIKSKAELSRKLSMSRATIGMWLNGNNKPSGDNLLKLAEALECSPEWLQTGKLSPIAAPVQNSAQQYSMIPMLDVELAAGHGSYAEQERAVDHVPISTEWIFQQEYYESDLKVVAVKGDSMTPRLHDGDLVLINLAENRPVHNGVYAIELEGELKIKRILRPDQWNTIISSDNEEYAPIPIQNTEISQLRIIGRAVKVVMGDL